MNLPQSAAAGQEKPHLVSAEEGARLGTAHLTHGVLQVRVNLNLLSKLGGFDLHKRSSHSLQVTALVVEGDTARPCKTGRP